jgi:hypothetical protein
VFYLNYSLLIDSKPEFLKFKIDWFVRELEKCAKTIRSMKLRLSQLKPPKCQSIVGMRETYKLAEKLFIEKIKEVELTVRKTFKFKKESLGYRGAGNLAIQGKQEKHFIKETFTSITFNIRIARCFIPEDQTCCFYFYFIDPRVKIIPVFKHNEWESEVLLVPGLFYSHVSSGEYEFNNKQHTYFVYLVRPYQPNIPNYNSFDVAQLEEKKKKFWELLDKSNKSNVRTLGDAAYFDKQLAQKKKTQKKKKNPPPKQKKGAAA